MTAKETATKENKEIASEKRDVETQLVSLTEAAAPAMEALVAGNTAMASENEELVSFTLVLMQMLALSLDDLNVHARGEERKAYHAIRIAGTTNCSSSIYGNLCIAACRTRSSVFVSKGYTQCSVWSR